jgi:hypothetical protein
MSQFSGSTFGRYSGRWLFAIGILELLLAGLFVFLAFIIPLVAFGFYLTAAILGITGIVLILIGARVRSSAAATDRLLATGIPGTAQVIGLTQTGMYLNENPQVSMNLLITLPGRPPYAATRKEFVPLILLGRLSSGAPLAVRVDPVDPQRVAIEWGGTGVMPMGMPIMPMGMGQQMGQPMGQPMAAGQQASQPASTTGMDESLSQVQAALASTGMQTANPFANPVQGQYTVEQLRQYLRTSGVQATATVDSLEDSGRIVGDERLFTMEMTLNMPGQAPKKLPKSAAMIPILSAHKISQGMTVPVRYAAENPDLLMVEWDKI